MLKLKKNVMDFLKANVKPDCLERVVNNFEDGIKKFKYWTVVINRCECLFEREIKFCVSLEDFEEVEELKPYVWYPREKFDGNPNKYWIVDRVPEMGDQSFYVDHDSNLCGLSQFTTHFMYIEPFDMSKK